MRLMITSMRNEAPFVLEWIAYHRLIGFTDFLVYTNDCDDGTDALLDRLAELKVLTHLPNPRRGRKAVQWQALSRARNHRLTKRAEWIMVADVDEFLVIHAGGGRLDDLFAAVPGAQGFAVPWRMFGSSGRLRFEPGLVIEQFQRAALFGLAQADVDGGDSQGVLQEAVADFVQPTARQIGVQQAVADAAEAVDVA